MSWACLAATGCGGPSGGSSSGVRGGAFAEKPGGGVFFTDSHQQGSATRLRLLDVSWGKLVDVFDVDASGRPGSEPVLRDFLVEESLTGVPGNYRVETNPVTRKTRVVVERTLGAPDQGNGTFEDLVRPMQSRLPFVKPLGPDAAGSFSFVPRNAALVLRFDDLLEDSEDAAARLAEVVRITAGYPPERLFEARVLFDSNHGGLADGAFHSTRVLVDLTVTEVEQADLPSPLPLNALGLPASLPSNASANFALRMPTRPDPASGQFSVLHNLGGKPLATTNNGPLDTTSPTLDVVRAARSGNRTDVNSGFLFDLNQPSLVARWPIVVGFAAPDPSGGQGLYRIDMTFTSPCRAAPRPGDIVRSGEAFLEVDAVAGAPDADGRVGDVLLRALDRAPADPVQLVGMADFFTTYDPVRQPQEGCWVRLDPPPGRPPSTDVDPEVRFVVRFSEPMDPDSVLAFDTLRLFRGARNEVLDPLDAVVARALPSADLLEFSLQPLMPLAHAQDGTLYHLALKGGRDGMTDLSGNELTGVPAKIELAIDALEAPVRNGGFVLSFDSENEFKVNDPDPTSTDLRGQIFYDALRGSIRPRPPGRASHTADSTKAVPSQMITFSMGLQTPLSPLGSKLQMLWRYCDFGWLVNDESAHNIDVEGLAWSPSSGTVLADRFTEFEIRFSHSVQIPDEFRSPRLLTFPASGLFGLPSPFVDNILGGPAKQEVAHHRALGYTLNPSDQFQSATGTILAPFPLNRAGGPYETYTWRDTSILDVGGFFGEGVPLWVEVLPPNELYGPGREAGFVAKDEEVPSFALPLLVEFRCYPSNSGVGLNALSILIASNAMPTPNFRVYSTGGIDQNGSPVIKEPDLELFPSGGFNPSSRPPGLPTRRVADNSFYIGQIDTVIRVSRAHTIWFQAGIDSPDYSDPLFEPTADEQPEGTRVEVDYRGALTFDPMDAEPFDARLLDPYGNTSSTPVAFFGGVPTWSDDINSVDGAPYLQIRLTFVNNIQGEGLSPELSGLGVAYAHQ